MVSNHQIKEQSGIKSALNSALITVNLAAFSFANQPPEVTQDLTQPPVRSGEPLPEAPADLFGDYFRPQEASQNPVSPSPAEDLFGPSFETPQPQIPSVESSPEAPVDLFGDYFRQQEASQNPISPSQSEDLFGPSYETPQPQIPSLEASLFPKDVGASREKIAQPLDIPSLFKPFDREHFRQEVWRARDTTNSGGEMFHYRFHLKPVEGAPSLSFCGVPVVAGWAHHDRDIDEIERHLVQQGFTVINKPLEEVIPPFEKRGGMLAELKLPSWVTTWVIPAVTLTLLLVTHLSLGRIKTFVKNRKGTDPDLKDNKLVQQGGNQELSVASSIEKNQPPIKSIDSFEILGDLQKALSINLKPGQRVIAEAGAMMHYQSEIEMRSVTGRSVGFAPVKMGMLGRFLIGESFFFQKFKNNSERTANVTLTPGMVGDFLHIDMSEFPDGLCADNGAFFAASSSVQLSIIKRAGLRGALTGIGIFQQRLSGTGDAFLFSPGKLHHFELGEGQRLVVDTHCLFAWQPSVEIKLKSLGIMEGITSGEGLYLCELSGPGKVWVSTSGSVARSNGTGGIFSGFGRVLDRVF